MDTDTKLKKTMLQFLGSLNQSGVTDLPPCTPASKIEHTSSPSVSEESTADNVDSLGSRMHDSADLRSGATTLSDPISLIETEGHSSESYGKSLSATARDEHLAQLRDGVASCTRCTELAECRTQTVFGVGSATPRLCFLGEGPGADEDRLGEPFVGRAGQLLDKIIEACKMKRQDVYILNTVKCRPPGNRNPLDSELENCWPFAQQQLEILQPEFICCLGAVAAKTLLNTSLSIGKLRQKFHRYLGSQVIVTYHPAYLLRTPGAKAKTWDDMKMLMDAMGIEYDR